MSVTHPTTPGERGEHVSDLVTFLQARLDEDEQAAREAARQHERAVAAFKVGRPTDMEDLPGETAADWSGGSDEDGQGYFRQAVWAGEGIATICEMRDEQDWASPVHIARHDPTRVLAEVAAKRRILELHFGEDRETDGGVFRDQCAVCDESMPCETLRLLALPHAKHEDYNPDWGPVT